jgi:hypothetical protein
MASPEDAGLANSGTAATSGVELHAGIRTVDLYHEIGPQPEDLTIEKDVPIDQVSPPTLVRVKSHVIAHGARALKSPQYLATIRRRESGTIATLIEGLEAHADSEDFGAWTHEPLERLRRLIHKLTEAEQFSDEEHEGNSCEILRQLRDTFLNTGWERYREQQVRESGLRILRRLAESDEVSADDCYWTMDELLELGLNPAAGTLLHYGEEEEEVPD